MSTAISILIIILYVSWSGIRLARSLKEFFIELPHAKASHPKKMVIRLILSSVSVGISISLIFFTIMLCVL